MQGFNPFPRDFLSIFRSSNTSPTKPTPNPEPADQPSFIPAIPASEITPYPIESSEDFFTQNVHHKLSSGTIADLDELKRLVGQRPQFSKKIVEDIVGQSKDPVADLTMLLKRGIYGEVLGAALLVGNGNLGPDGKPNPFKGMTLMQMLDYIREGNEEYYSYLNASLLRTLPIHDFFTPLTHPAIEVKRLHRPQE